MCLNKKVIAAVAIVALGIYLSLPGLVAAAVPLLVFAACPLSMVLMMRMMSRSSDGYDAPAARTAADEELSRLRIEVDRLRAEQHDEVAAAERQSG